MPAPAWEGRHEAEVALVSRGTTLPLSPRQDKFLWLGTNAPPQPSCAQVSLRIVNDLVNLYKKEELRLVPESLKMWGVTPTAELINGRAAMVTLAAATLWGGLQGKVLELVSDPRFFN